MFNEPATELQCYIVTSKNLTDLKFKWTYNFPEDTNAEHEISSTDVRFFY